MFLVVGLTTLGLRSKLLTGVAKKDLRALGAGERGRTASAGQGTRDLILRGRGTRKPGEVPGVMFFAVCEGAQSAIHNLADRGGAGSAVHDLGQDGFPDQISVLGHPGQELGSQAQCRQATTTNTRDLP